jgi:hypothetical protein
LNNHAAQIQKYYGDFVSTFDNLVGDMEAHQAGVGFSSNSDDYLNHPSYDSLVHMGKSIIPLVTEKYAHDRAGWWHELLFENEFGRRSGADMFSKDDLFERWKTIYEEGTTWEISSLNAPAESLWS